MSTHTPRPEVVKGLALIAEGMALREAARTVGVSKTSLVNARKRAELPPLPRGRRWPAKP